MTEDEFCDFVNSLKPLDLSACENARKYQANLAMPPGSLGMLQELAVQIAGITGNIKNEIAKKRIIVLCADNGVAQEGVASAPQSVTASQAVNMTEYKTGMSAIAKNFGCEVQVVDVGIKCDYSCDKILNKKIRRGTNNISKTFAMSREECLAALATGIELAKKAKNEGVQILGTGEMGIGNTTTSTAVLCALTNANPNDVTGRGGGITDEAFARKKTVIQRALDINKPDSSDVLGVIAKVGGFDIAAMCGVFLGAAQCRLPVVIDGYISMVSALCAKRISSISAGYFIPSHKSKEKGYLLAAEEVGVRPFLDLNMRLGEGSGCPLAFEVVKAACVIMNDMASFNGAGIDDSYLNEIRKQRDF
ncbi:MAG: nicotinate-nucleotide--dimethylbenzimidazole phosphoribosyltransferase [Treponema sp.]|nr:nicotinate-nucleotide--dimethylbenzimidazole phosphoribosyltransferase [Treponema sp.]